ncbi:MAG: hypothetical protein HY924_03430 [Elusimicrobia bacterium]|nr:hypothetical protein [Elusimicrobiota bacterium]
MPSALRRVLPVLALAACLPAQSRAAGRVIVPVTSRGAAAIPSYVSPAAGLRLGSGLGSNALPSLPAVTGLQGLEVPDLGLPLPAPTLAAPDLPSEASAPETDKEGTGLAAAVRSAVQGKGKEADLRSAVGADLVTQPAADTPGESQQDWAGRSFEKLRGGSPVEAQVSEVEPSLGGPGSGNPTADARLEAPDTALSSPVRPEPAAPSKSKAADFLDSHPRLKEVLLSGLEAFGPLIGTAFFMGTVYLSFTYLPLMAAIATIPLTIMLMAKPMDAFHRFQDARLEARYADERPEPAPKPEVPPAPEVPPTPELPPVETPQPAPQDPVPSPAPRLSPDARLITGALLRREAEKAGERAGSIDPEARLVEARIDLEDPSSHWVFVFHAKGRVITVWQKRIGVKRLKGPAGRTLETVRLSYMGRLEDAAAKAVLRDPGARLKTGRIVRTPRGARYELVER